MAAHHQLNNTHLLPKPPQPTNTNMKIHSILPSTHQSSTHIEPPLFTNFTNYQSILPTQFIHPPPFNNPFPFPTIPPSSNNPPPPSPTILPFQQYHYPPKFLPFINNPPNHSPFTHYPPFIHQQPTTHHPPTSTGAIRRSAPFVVVSLLLLFISLALSIVGQNKNDVKTLVGALFYILSSGWCGWCGWWLMWLVAVWLVAVWLVAGVAGW